MKKILSLLISIFTTFLLVLSVTYALYKWGGTDNTDVKFDANLEIVYQTESNNITGTLAPSTDKSVGLNTDVKFWTKSVNSKVYGNVYLSVNTIDENLTSTDVLKWEVWNDSKKVNEGSFEGVETGSKVRIVDNTELKTVEDNYEVYIWLDETKVTSNMSNVSFETSVYAEASQVEYKKLLTYNCTYNKGTCNIEDVELSEDTIIDLTKTSSREGYTFIGWNTDKDAHVGLTELENTEDNITLYAIFEKEIEATFDNNGASSLLLSNNNTNNIITNTINKTDKLTPLLGAYMVENNDVVKASCKIYNREETCEVTTPEIVKENYIGLEYALESNAKEVITAPKTKIKITNNAKYYAITRSVQPLVATFQKDGATQLEYTEKGCYLYNRENSCMVKAPKIIVDDRKHKDGFMRVSGFSPQDKVSENGTITLTSSVTYQAVVTDLLEVPTSSLCVSRTYNGNSQILTNTTSTGYTLTNNNQVNAGMYTITATLNSNHMWSDSTTTTKTFTCSINKRDVTYKADDGSKVYDGNSLTNTTATLTSGTLVTGHTAAFTTSGSITNVGSTTNTLSGVVIKNGTIDVTNNYNITKQNGTLTVTKASAVIPTNSLCVARTYNGAAQNLTSITSGTGYTLSNYSQTNAGTYTITATLNNNYKWSDNSVTTKTFSCSIDKKTVTYKADNDTKVYDGKPLTNSNATITAGTLVTGHIATFNVSGSITNVGSTTNTLNGVTIKSGGTDVSSNYVITKQNGTLTVAKATATIPTNSLCVSRTYSGATQNLTSVTSGAGYTLSNYSQTNAGTYTITATLNNNYHWSDGATTTKTFTCTLGQRAVTYKADDGSKVYDGSALTKPTVTLISGTLVTDHTATFTISGTITDAGSTTNTLSGVVIKNGFIDVSSNYNITKQNGTLTVTKASATIPTNSLCVARTYTGSAQTLTSATSGIGYILSNYSQTNAGTYAITATLNSNYKWSDDSTTTKTFNCLIDKKAVTYTADSSSKTYDGSALTKNTCTLSSGSLISGHAATCSVSGTITSAGSIANTLSSVVIKSGTTDVSSNYAITKANGTLTINKRAVTYTAGSTSRAYNGSALTNTTASITSGSLVSGHTATVTTSGTITNVGSTTNTLSTVVIKSGSTDVSSNYVITKANGTLTVTKASATIPTNSLCVARTYTGAAQTLTSTTSGTGYTLSNYSQTNAGTYTITATLNGNYKWSDSTTTTKTFTCALSKKTVTYKADSTSKTYDGSALTKNTCTLSSGSLISGHTATCTISGTITNAGSATNTLSSVVIKSGTTDVSSNYAITKANGILTVTKASATIPTNSLCVARTYTGSAQTLTSATSGTGYTLSNYSGTNAGTYTITATLNGNYQWSDGATTTKTFSCTLSKKALTYTADSSSKTYDGSALTKNTCTLSSGTLVSDQTATCTISGTITNVGSATNTLSNVVIKNGETDVSSNYAITKTNGTLSVNKRAVTVTAGTTSRAYNGSALTNTTCTGNNLVSGQTVTCTMASTSTITNVGSVTNTLSTTVIKSGSTDVSSNYTITKANGTLTVTNASFTSSSVTISGTPLVGNTLTSNPTSNPTASSYTYQWWTSTSSTATSGTNISGATSQTYKLTTNENGLYVGVTVTSNLANYTSITASKVTTLTNTLSCSISGNPTSYVTSATLTGTISSGVTGYAWTNSTATPTSWTSSSSTTQTKAVTANATWYLHIKSDASNTTYCSVTVSKIDTTGPTISTLNVEGDGGAQTITATITASDTQSGIENYYYSLDNETFIASTNPNYTWTGKTPGAYTVYTYVKDKLGNQSSTSSKSVTLVDPFVKLPDGMIPIKYNGSSWVKANVANTNNDWYNYDNKLWTNAVMVNSTNRTTYMNASVGTAITETDILAYYVWIPRYKYKLFNATFAESSPQEIDIVFESPSDAISNGTTNGEYLSHPAFWWDNDSDGVRETGEELSGIWVGKFETTGDTTTPTVLPSTAPIVSQTVSTLFTTTQKLNTNTYLTNTGVNQVDSHMLKNMEWGAVAYLSHSKYGINTEIGKNNYYNSAYTTGCGAAPGTSSASTCNAYNTTTGMQASTTGNITGIYDMSGGTYEYVMGVMQDNTNTNTPMSGYSTSSNSGFTGRLYASGNFTAYTGITFPDKKYYELYDFGTTYIDQTAYNRSKLGDATGETRSWYSDYAYFVDATYPWFLRGGRAYDGAGAGAFAFYHFNGWADTILGARAVLSERL